jgi:aminopeptidase N
MRNWQLIASQLNADSTKISKLNRAQILDDALNLARSSMLPYNFVFTLTQYLRHHENDFSPWESFFDGVAHIFDMLDETPAFTYFKVRN